MWDWSTAARAALAGDHTAAVRVDILHSGAPVHSLEVTGGSVSVDATRAIRWNLQGLTCTDPTGTLTRADVDDLLRTDLLDPYLCEIAPHRGVSLSSGPELAPLGVYGLTGRTVRDTPDGLVIDLAGQDRTMIFQGPMSSALAINAGTRVEDAIVVLLRTRLDGFTASLMDTGYRCGPLLFPPDVDVWAEAQQLAASVGARLFHDRSGQLVLTPAGPASDRPVAVYAEGDGLLLDVVRAEDTDTVRNVVVAETPDGRVRAVAEDTDRRSPTFAGGRYGRRVHTLVNPYFSTTTQAQVAATNRLAYELGRSETVEATVVCDPGRDVDEVVTVHRPRADLDNRALIVATLDIPLGVESAMPLGCRRTRLSSDGRELAAPVLPA